MLTPDDIGLKNSDGHNITMKSLFIDNKFITKSEFWQQFAPINFLSYNKLKGAVEQNIKNDRGFQMDMNERITETHITSTLTNFFRVKQKGSKIFRNILVP